MTENNRNVVDVINNIINIIPPENKSIIFNLNQMRESYQETLRYSAPEVVDIINYRLFQKLSYYLPTLELNDNIKHKIQKIFENKK